MNEVLSKLGLVKELNKDWLEDTGIRVLPCFGLFSLLLLYLEGAHQNGLGGLQHGHAQLVLRLHKINQNQFGDTSWLLDIHVLLLEILGNGFKSVIIGHFDLLGPKVAACRRHHPAN